MNVFSKRGGLVALSFAALFAVIGALSIFAISATAQKTDKKLGKVAVKPQENITSKTHGDWVYRCFRPQIDKKNTGIKQCEIAQIVSANYEKRPINILTLALAKDKRTKSQDENGKPTGEIVSIVLPLNVRLKDGFVITIDDKKPVFQVPFRNCNQTGCWLVERVPAEMIKAFQNGQFGYAQFGLMTGQNLRVKFSLKGFTAAYTELMQSLEKG